MKKILFAILGILCLLSILTPVYALAPTPTIRSAPLGAVPHINVPITWTWQTCAVTSLKGTMEAVASVGSDQLTITWTVPAKSSEYVPACQLTRLLGVSVAAYVNSPGLIPQTGTCVSGASVGFCQFTLQIQENIGGKVIIRNYDLKAGDKIVADVTPTYFDYQHGNTVSFSCN